MHTSEWNKLNGAVPILAATICALCENKRRQSETEWESERERRKIVNSGQIKWMCLCMCLLSTWMHKTVFYCAIRLSRLGVRILWIRICGIIHLIRSRVTGFALVYAIRVCVYVCNLLVEYILHWLYTTLFCMAVCRISIANLPRSHWLAQQYLRTSTYPSSSFSPLEIIQWSIPIVVGKKSPWHSEKMAAATNSSAAGGIYGWSELWVPHHL